MPLVRQLLSNFPFLSFDLNTLGQAIRLHLVELLRELLVRGVAIPDDAVTLALSLIRESHQSLHHQYDDTLRELIAWGAEIRHSHAAFTEDDIAIIGRIFGGSPMILHILFGRIEELRALIDNQDPEKAATLISNETFIEAFRYAIARRRLDCVSHLIPHIVVRSGVAHLQDALTFVNVLLRRQRLTQEQCRDYEEIRMLLERAMGLAEDYEASVTPQTYFHVVPPELRTLVLMFGIGALAQGVSSTKK